MKTSLFLGLSMAALLFAGCSSSSDNVAEELPPVTPSEKQIPINIATQMWTRATDAGFESGDQTGLYVVNYVQGNPGTLQNSGNHVNNMRFTYTTKWTPDQPIYWLDNTTHADFYCYYPYAAAVTDVTAYPFSVQTDQSVMANYKASDFLWAKTSNVAPSADPVQLNTRHAMSNLIVKLKAGKGYQAEDLKNAKVEIVGLKHQSTVNLTNGVATATGTAAAIQPLVEEGQYRALIVPQSISNAPLVKVTIGKATYTLNQTMTFEAHKQHTCTITANKTNGGINIGIDGWDKDEIDHGGIVE